MLKGGQGVESTVVRLLTDKAYLEVIFNTSS